MLLVLCLLTPPLLHTVILQGGTARLAQLQGLLGVMPVGDKSDLGGQGALPRGGWLSEGQDSRGGSDNWLPASPPRHSMAASTSNAAPVVTSQAQVRLDCHPSQHKLLQACEHGSLDAYIIQHTCQGSPV